MADNLSQPKVLFLFFFLGFRFGLVFFSLVDRIKPITELYMEFEPAPLFFRNKIDDTIPQSSSPLSRGELDDIS